MSRASPLPRSGERSKAVMVMVMSCSWLAQRPMNMPPVASLCKTEHAENASLGASTANGAPKPLQCVEHGPQVLLLVSSRRQAERHALDVVAIVLESLSNGSQRMLVIRVLRAEPSRARRGRSFHGGEGPFRTSSRSSGEDNRCEAVLGCCGPGDWA